MSAMTPEPAAPEQGQLAHAASCAHFGMSARQAAAAWLRRDAKGHAYFAAIERGVIDAWQRQNAEAAAGLRETAPGDQEGPA